MIVGIYKIILAYLKAVQPAVGKKRPKIILDNLKNKIFCAEASKLLALLPDKCIDLALIDPPYGIDYTGQLKRKLGGKGLSISKYSWVDRGGSNKTWDKERISPDIIREVIRVSKNQIIWGGNYYADILKPSQGYLIWNKGQRGFSLADGEIAWTSYNKALRIFDYSRSRYKADEPNKIHDTQKPVKLFEWCIDKAKIKPGAIILDCLCGSATTAIAAYNKGFDFICSDNDPNIIKKAQERYVEHTRQVRLLNPKEIEEIAVQAKIEGVQA